MKRPALFLAAPLGLLLGACTGGDGDTAGANTTSTTTINLPPIGSTSSTTGEPDPTTGGPEVPTSSGTTEQEFVCDEFVPSPIMPVIPRVMLVLDKSGSMISPEQGFWDHDGDPNTADITRWMSLHDVVASIFANLDEVIDFGAVLFPALNATGSYSAAACVMDAAPLVPIGSNAGAAILAALPPADTATIAGGTPTTAGMTVALDQLASLEDDEPKFIILVTDGAANCKEGLELPELFDEYDDELAKVVTEAHTMGISTYVIGIDIKDEFSPTITDGSPDNTNTYIELNALAELGGTARAGDEKFYNASNQTELQAALESITEQVLSCEIDLGKPIPHTFYIQEVEIGGDDHPDQQAYGGFDTQVTDCDAEAGWQYTSDTREAILLCGAACDFYKQTGILQIEYGCVIP